MATPPNRTDRELCDAVLWRLAWHPGVDASGVSVSAQKRVVTLAGHVETYRHKLAAGRVTRRTPGVRGVVNALEVRPLQPRTDAHIERDAIEILRNRIDVPLGVGVTVRDGYVTVSGTVTQPRQRAAAEDAVSGLTAVRGVMNRIHVGMAVSPKEVRRQIVAALGDGGEDRIRRIDIRVNGPSVTLIGSLQSWLQKDAAERAVWRVPGVVFIDSQIDVAPPSDSRTA